MTSIFLAHAPMHKKKHAKLSTMDDSQTAFDGTTGHMEVEAVE
jgi:hypothetical protein